VILSCVILTQYRSVMDRQTDRRLNDSQNALSTTCCRWIIMSSSSIRPMLDDDMMMERSELIQKVIQTPHKMFSEGMSD